MVICSITVAFSAIAWFLVKEPKDEMTENPVLLDEKIDEELDEED